MSVALREVGHRFGNGSWLFRGLTHEFLERNVYALTGPSGSGKSTLLSMLARLDTPLEGTIEFGQLSRISWVFQNPFGSPRRSAVDHVVLPLLTAGAHIDEAESRGHELLDRFELAAVADRPFRELSGGEAQRLMLARGIAANPDLLLVDEPTAQLDRRTAAQVDSVLGSLAAENTIVIVATHDPHTKDACSYHLDLGEMTAGRE